ESSTVEVDGRLEVFSVAEAAGRLLDPLDNGVDALETRIGQTMPEVGQQVRQVTADELGDGRHGLEAAMGGTPVPAGEERLGGAGIPVGPEGAEPFLESPGPTDLEVLALQGAEGRALLVGHVLRAPQPQVLGPGEPLVARPFEDPVLSAADVIDGVMQMLDDVELVEHDLVVRPRQMRPRRLHV